MKRCTLLSVFTFAAVSPAFSGEIAPQQIIAAAVGDWNSDGNPDLALLVAPRNPDDDIGIYIYLRDEKHLLLKLAAAAPNKVVGNARLDELLGKDATISALPNGSIAVHSENSGVGRDRWEETLTIAYRNTVFVVAGFTYVHYDSLDPDNSGSCDYNVLTGKVSQSGKDSRVDAKTVKIGDWADSLGMKACGILDE